MPISKNFTKKWLLAICATVTVAGSSQLRAMVPATPASIFSVLGSTDINDSVKFRIISELIAENPSRSPEEYYDLIEQQNGEGETPLLVAIENMRFALISLLLMQKGANVNAPSGKYKGQTAVHKAVGARGEDRYLTDDKLTNTLQYKLSVLRTMIEECNADLGAEEYLCKRTPVHIAAQQATLDVVKFVVKNLAKQNKLHLLFKKDKYNRDALKFAQEGMTKQPPQTQDVVDYLATLKEYVNDHEMLRAIIESLQ